jgi:hypothetical protein
MTLFDSTSFTAAPDLTIPAAVLADVIDLPCRLTGCTRPLEAHTVTQAAIENALHPRKRTSK